MNDKIVALEAYRRARLPASEPITFRIAAANERIARMEAADRARGLCRPSPSEPVPLFDTITMAILKLRAARPQRSSNSDI
jgi:hypothetical protein